VNELSTFEKIILLIIVTLVGIFILSKLGECFGFIVVMFRDFLN